MDEKILKLGIYEHYKGKKYEVIGVARHSETLEKMVAYHALHGDKELWMRPLEIFMEEVEIDGTKKPRFNYLGK